MAVRSQDYQSNLTTTTGTTTVYTVPTGFVAKVDKITLTNYDTSTDCSGTIIYFGGTADANIIEPSITIPKNDKSQPSISNHTLGAGTTLIVKKGAGPTAINVNLSVTERTQP